MVDSGTRRPPSIWKYKGLDVYYYPELDGGGTILAASFVDFIQKRVTQESSFGRAFEWCSGPGFIGFALLAEGACERLCLADINPRAVECVAQTVSANRLQDRVSYYVSDNFDTIPETEVFDLVVSNPPNFFAMNTDHRFYSSFISDLRPHDPGWKIHSSFYTHVGRYLSPGAFLCVSEVEPHEKTVFIPDSEPVPFDSRPGPPIEDFKRMIEAGGLLYVDAIHYTTMEGGVGMWMIVSTKGAS